MPNNSTTPLFSSNEYQKINTFYYLIASTVFFGVSEILPFLNNVKYNGIFHFFYVKMMRDVQARQERVINAAAERLSPLQTNLNENPGYTDIFAVDL